MALLRPAQLIKPYKAISKADESSLSLARLIVIYTLPGQMAHFYTNRCHTPSSFYRYRKVWRYGLEVACKIKGSQGKPRVEWIKPEHPFTAISLAADVQSNHNEALNSSIRRRCSAYRRRQNHYAKTSDGLQQAITAQRLIHNWIRPHWSLDKEMTPAMAMGFCDRPIPMEEFLTLRGFAAITN